MQFKDLVKKVISIPSFSGAFFVQGHGKSWSWASDKAGRSYSRSHPKDLLYPFMGSVEKVGQIWILQGTLNETIPIPKNLEGVEILDEAPEVLQFCPLDGYSWDRMLILEILENYMKDPPLRVKESPWYYGPNVLAGNLPLSFEFLSRKMAANV